MSKSKFCWQLHAIRVLQLKLHTYIENPSLPEQPLPTFLKYHAVESADSFLQAIRHLFFCWLDLTEWTRSRASFFRACNRWKRVLKQRIGLNVKYS